MADLIIVYWRDIPAQVIVRKGRQNAKRELPLRFTEAIDMCAMRTGAGETDAYLAEWRKADPVPVGDDLEAEADKALAEFDTTYDRERLVALVKAGGRETDKATTGRETDKATTGRETDKATTGHETDMAEER